VVQLELFDLKRHRPAAERFIRLFKISDDAPSLNHLCTILQAFAHLPYENLSKIIKLHQRGSDSPFRFPEEVISDHELYKLGGTCFSLTFTLKSILDYYGYQTSILMADMKAGPNSHCLLLLDFEGRQYLLDPGYLIQHPLPLSDLTATAGIRLNYSPDTRRYELFTAERQQFRWRYSFVKEPVSLDKFVQLWQESFHWFSMHGICLSRRDEAGFLYIHNHYIKKISPGEYLKGNFSEDIAELIRRYFQIEPEVVEQAQKMLRDNLYYDKGKGYRVPGWVR